MNQQPDKLFRDKLQKYGRPAPANAWDKIVAIQQKTSQKITWSKIAAAIILLFVAAFLLWSKAENADTASPEIAETVSELPPINKLPRNQNNREAIPAVELPTTLLAEEKKSNEVTPALHSSTRQKDSNLVVELLPPDDSILLEEEAPKAMLLIQIHNEQTSMTKVETSSAAEEETITLVYTSKEVGNYLDKKRIDQATSEDKKPSTLMKLLKKANALASNQDPIGELRQKKSEILALNFKSEKQRGQNK